MQKEFQPPITLRDGQTISAALAKYSSLPKPTAAAVSSTLSALYISTSGGGTQGGTDTPILFPGDAVLLCHSVADHIGDISPTPAQLTQCANAAANSLACTVAFSRVGPAKVMNMEMSQFI